MTAKKKSNNSTQARSRPGAGYTRIRKICLVFPDTEELIKWGNPHFCVKGKIFAGYGEESGGARIGFKLPMDVAEANVREHEHFHKAKYVGHKGWVSVDAGAIRDWRRIAAMVEESYRLIAPKRSIAKLDG